MRLPKPIISESLPAVEKYSSKAASSTSGPVGMVELSAIAADILLMKQKAPVKAGGCRGLGMCNALSRFVK